VKRIVSACLLSLALVGCGARHEPPNLSPVAHAKFIADPFTIALSDFQDGVIADHNLGYLSTKDTRIVMDALQVAYTAIEASVDARRDPLKPGGAKDIAIAMLKDLQGRLPKRFAPYIDSALITMGGK
jgi:hypothetical protein